MVHFGGWNVFDGSKVLSCKMSPLIIKDVLRYPCCQRPCDLLFHNICIGNSCKEREKQRCVSILNDRLAGKINA